MDANVRLLAERIAVLFLPVDIHGAEVPAARMASLAHGAHDAIAAIAFNAPLASSAVSNTPFVKGGSIAYRMAEQNCTSRLMRECLLGALVL